MLLALTYTPRLHVEEVEHGIGTVSFEALTLGIVSRVGMKSSSVHAMLACRYLRIQ